MVKIIEESLSLADKEVEMIKKALEKYNGKRKMAAGELGISERTLYRKIKEYGIESNIVRSLHPLSDINFNTAIIYVVATYLPELAYPLYKNVQRTIFFRNRPIVQPKTQPGI